MYQYNYSRAMDNNNNNNNGRGRGFFGFSGFPTMINTSSIPRTPVNPMFPKSLVSAYRANDPRIANSSAIPNANYGMMMPMSKVHGEASCICPSSMRNIHESGGLIDPNMNGFIRLHPNHSVEWKEERGNLDPRLSSAKNNVKSMHSFEMMLSNKAPPHANAFAINNGAQQALTHGSIPLEDAAVAAENGPDEPRKRKREKMVIQQGMPARSFSRDGPRTAVRVESQEDIPDDGYSWRKYGQKRVKGNSHGPRCYYRCNISGCNTRKQVERCAADARYVITTYDGKHSHEVPPPKGKNKFIFYNELAEFQTPPAQPAELNNAVTFLVPNMAATLSDHAGSSSSATPHAAGGSSASASSATDAVPPPPFLFDLNLPLAQELDDDASTEPEV